MSFAGVFARNVTVISSTEIQAYFPSGVPVINNLTCPVVYFTNSSTTTHFANCPTGGRVINTIANPIASTPANCSFAGGCTFNISYPGLASTLS